MSARILRWSLGLWLTVFGPLYAQPGEPVRLTSSNLPILIIDTHGQVIPEAPRIRADMGIIYNGKGQTNRIGDEWNGYRGLIDIELRGATSAEYPKKPYRLETVDDEGENRNVSLLGMPAENDWILHNPYSDKSLMRNVLAYRFARDLGSWVSRTRLCEVVLNGDYQGVYVLMEKIKRDENRIDIAALDEEDVDGDRLTGGYILKIDRLSGEQNGHWDTRFGTRYRYHYPAPDEILPEQRSYIADYMNRFEILMASPDYADPAHGYAEYLHVDSFVDYFLVNELCRNIDGYRLSAYLYKDRDSKGGLLNMVVWDFNFALGNADYYGGGDTEGWNLDVMFAPDFADRFRPPFWWERLREDERFMLQAARRWRAMRAGGWRTDLVLGRVDSLAAELAQAQIRNFVRWPILGEYVWPNAFVGDSYEAEIDYLKSWLSRRAEWMDGAFSEIAAAADSDRTAPERSLLYPNAPNPFREETRIQYDLGEAAEVEIAVYNGLGQRVRILLDGRQEAGSHAFTWGGKDRDGRLVADGVYYVRMRAGDYAGTRKVLLMR